MTSRLGPRWPRPVRRTPLGGPRQPPSSVRCIATPAARPCQRLFHRCATRVIGPSGRSVGERLMGRTIRECRMPPDLSRVGVTPCSAPRSRCRPNGSRTPRFLCRALGDWRRRRVHRRIRRNIAAGSMKGPCPVSVTSGSVSCKLVRRDEGDQPTTDGIQLSVGFLPLISTIPLPFGPRGLGWSMWHASDRGQVAVRHLRTSGSPSPLSECKGRWESHRHNRRANLVQ
jgi:hypothetical protein